MPNPAACASTKSCLSIEYALQQGTKYAQVFPTSAYGFPSSEMGAASVVGQCYLETYPSKNLQPNLWFKSLAATPNKAGSAFRL